ncbi:hypothetical protein B7494_g6325 [Chlorociboria aeruginascens]|nr:hypothetical protein B7494_g6325 [Chlorociboria aeruginascens]
MDDAVDPSAAHYNDGNRAFLQALMARGTLTLQQGKELLAAIFTIQEGQPTGSEAVTQQDLDSFISAAADALSPFDYEIRSTHHQVSKERIYAIVNSNSDPLTQLATIRTPEEIFYVKRVLDEMFEGHNTRGKEVMAISSMEAIRAKLIKGTGRQSMERERDETQVTDRGVTKEQAERTLANLVTEGWFERSREGYYTLSPRALMELRTWLVETYNDSDDPEEWQPIKFCGACKEIVTIGQRCAERQCNVRLHDVCQTAFWNSRQSKHCPKCKVPWTGKHFVGQRVITTTDDYLKGKRRSGGVKRSRTQEDEVQDEEEEGEGEGEGEE